MKDQFLLVRVKTSDFDPETMELVEGWASKAGRASMAKLTPEQRRSLSRKGAKARWRKTRKPAGKMRPIDIEVEAGKVRSFPSITAAAKSLRVSRTTVYRWIVNAEESSRP